jgi:hypothetical protein
VNQLHYDLHVGTQGSYWTWPRSSQAFLSFR